MRQIAAGVLVVLSIIAVGVCGLMQPGSSAGRCRSRRLLAPLKTRLQPSQLPVYAEAEAGMGTALEPGQVSVQASVQMVFEVAP